tara:strand:- start:2788 stop:3045 length:258 start_codon:yes stop_codon:yes gene_type:complete
MKFIRANTPCFVSKVGHNNFLYPVFDETGSTVFIEDIPNPDMKSWVCGNSTLRAIEVELRYIKDLYGNPSTKTVVWVHQDDIKSG